MHQWSRNDKFAFLGVILAVIGLACGLFGQEIRQSLGLQQPQTLRQSSLTAAPSDNRPPRGPLQAAAPTMTIKVSGDTNTISLQPSSVASESRDYDVEGGSSESDFLLGPKQTARVEFTGDGNTIRVAPKLAGRVTIVDNGDGNKVTH